ncbi:MAG: beta-N-acetylhexosaminidase [Gammaproteobacteria bacterium]
MSLGPLMVDLCADTMSAKEKELLNSPQVGGVILFSRNFTSLERLVELIKEIHEIRHPRLLIAIDQEGGRVQRLRDGFTQLPAINLLGQIHDSDPKRAGDLAAVSGWLMAAELRSIGIDFSFAPILDLNYGVSQVIGDRAFHKNPEIVATLASRYIQGMRKAGMQAVGKHFPGHGAVTADSHIELPTDVRKFEDIAMQDLIPFQRMIHQGLAGLMSAHVVYEKVDPEIATFSKLWLQDVLRKQMEFNGVIFSDDLSMKAAHCNDGDSDEYLLRTQKALDAGCDMALICNSSDNACLVAEQLEGYNNPASQIRLTRMHGGKEPLVYQELRSSKEWGHAVSLVESYQDSPYGELAL